jgi:hypothetical protein
MAPTFFSGKWKMDSFEDLVQEIGSTALGKLTRSTVPLLDWLRAEQNRRDLATSLGLGVDDALEAHVEYAVRASGPCCGGDKGKGKASFTDVALRFPMGSVAIEAKHLEPLYDLVRVWLSDGKKDNRLKVLKHWGHTIPARLDLDERTAGNLVYQMVHRAASARAFADAVSGTGKAIAAHVVFSKSDKKAYDYQGPLQELAKLIPKHRVELALIWIEIQSETDYFRKIEALNDYKQPEAIAEALATHEPLFAFGKPNRLPL